MRISDWSSAVCSSDLSNAGRIERAADDVVLHRREVLHAAATHQHHRVLLQVMADAGDVRGNLNAISQAHAGDLPKRRVRLLRVASHYLEKSAERRDGNGVCSKLRS